MVNFNFTIEEDIYSTSICGEVYLGENEDCYKTYAFLKKWHDDFINAQKTLPYEFQKILNEHIEDLYA